VQFQVSRISRDRAGVRGGPRIFSGSPGMAAVWNGEIARAVRLARAAYESRKRRPRTERDRECRTRAVLIVERVESVVEKLRGRTQTEVQSVNKHKDFDRPHLVPLPTKGFFGKCR
jgi:hypothetical protein